MLREFVTTPIDSNDDDDELSALLQSNRGRAHLQDWVDTFSLTFESLDEAVEQHASGQAFTGLDWQKGVQAADRALESLAKRVGAEIESDRG